MTFGEFVKSRRMARRITLRAFSERVGYDPANYSRTERDLTPPPASSARLAAFARELGIAEGSDDYREMVRLAALGRGQIPPAALTDEAVLAKLPVLFRTLEGGPIDAAMLDELLEAIRRE